MPGSCADLGVQSVRGVKPEAGRADCAFVAEAHFTELIVDVAKRP
jgi:hypothetical protein